MKILVIRISSFGDIVQALRVPYAIKNKYPEAKLHWLVRTDFESLVKNHPKVDTTHTIQKSSSIAELIQCFQKIKNEDFDLIYDAHNNLRSNLLRIFLIFGRHKWLSRSKDRIKRFLFFKFRFKVLPSPFIGQKSFLAPLKKWGISDFNSPPPYVVDPLSLEKVKPLLQTKEDYQVIACAPSANWQMKRWPTKHWQKLLELSKNKKWHFVFLGGSEDHFIEAFLAEQDNPNYTNLSGKLSLSESSAALSISNAVVANDTGLLHIADQLGVNTLALIGPTAFGYPYSSTSKVLEVDLNCKPCSKDGRGKCVQKTYQLCMVQITPERVFEELENLLS